MFEGTGDTPVPSNHLKRKRSWVAGFFTGLAYVAAAGLLTLAVAIFSGQVGARVVLTTSMQPTLNPGDLVITENWLKPHVGQIAIYKAFNLEGKERAEFVHRVIAGSADTGYTFKGDNNATADPFAAAPSAVVGVVKMTIPHASVFLKPLTLGIFFVVLILFYFLVAFVRHRRQISNETAAPVTPVPLDDIATQSERRVRVRTSSSLSPRVKSLVISIGSLVALFSLLNGLAAAKIFGFEHVKIGPQLAIGNANSTIIAVAPGATPKQGQFAVANLNGIRNFVRVDGVTSDGYQISTMGGKATVGKEKLDGPMLFFIPFIGYPWLWLGQ